MGAMLVSLVLYLYNASEVCFVKEKALFRLIKHAFSPSVLTNLHTYIYAFIARPYWVYQSQCHFTKLKKNRKDFLFIKIIGGRVGVLSGIIS